MTDKYVLEGHVAVPVEDSMLGLLKWGKWFQTADRHVAKTDIAHVHVSTVFLGLNHSYVEGPPLIYETMVFGGPLDGEQDRYSTWDEAELGHAAMVERVNQAFSDNSSD